MLLAKVTPRRYGDKPGGLEWKDTLTKPVQIQSDDIVAARGEKDGIRLLLKAPDGAKIRRHLLPWAHLRDPNVGGYVAFSLEPLFDLQALVACAKWRARVRRTLWLHWPFVIPYGIALLLFVAGGTVGFPDPQTYEASPPGKPFVPAGPLLVVLSLLIFVVTMIVVLVRSGMLFRAERYEALGFLLPKRK